MFERFFYFWINKYNVLDKHGKFMQTVEMTIVTEDLPLDIKKYVIEELKEMKLM